MRSRSLTKFPLCSPRPGSIALFIAYARSEMNWGFIPHLLLPAAEMKSLHFHDWTIPSCNGTWSKGLACTSRESHFEHLHGGGFRIRTDSLKGNYQIVCSSCWGTGDTIKVTRKMRGVNSRAILNMVALLKQTEIRAAASYAVPVMITAESYSDWTNLFLSIVYEALATKTISFLSLSSRTFCTSRRSRVLVLYH